MEDAISELLEPPAGGFAAAGTDDESPERDVVLNPRPMFDDTTNAELQGWAELEVTMQQSVFCTECGRIARPGEWFCSNDKCENGLTLQSFKEMLPEMVDIVDQTYIRDRIAAEEGRSFTVQGNSLTTKKIRLAKSMARAAGVLKPEPQEHLPTAPAATAAIVSGLAAAATVSGLAAADTMFSTVPDISELNAKDYEPDPCNVKLTRPRAMQERLRLIRSYGREDAQTHCAAYVRVEEYARHCQGQRIGPLFVIKRRCLATGETDARNHFFDNIDIESEVRVADEQREDQQLHGDGAAKMEKRKAWVAKMKASSQPRYPSSRADELLSDAADAFSRRGVDTASAFAGAGSGASSSSHHPSRAVQV